VGVRGILNSNKQKLSERRKTILTKFDFQTQKFDYLIRRGQKNGDGGYLIPKNVNADLLISFGLGDNWKFENELVKVGQVKSFIVFDHTQNLINYLKQVASRLKLQNFNLNLLAGRTIVTCRYFKDFIFLQKKHVKRKISRNGYGLLGQLKSYEINIPEIFERYVYPKNQTILLKVDIEGSEYEIIEQIMSFSNQIILIVIEFHGIINKADEFKKLLDLIKSEYSLIHTHINNNGKISENNIPDICEFTFYSKKEFDGSLKVNKIPLSKLDQPNSKKRVDFQIDFNAN